MNFQNLIFSVVETEATIAFSRPEALNAMNAKPLIELQDSASACGNDPETKGVTLTGQKTKGGVRPTGNALGDHFVPQETLMSETRKFGAAPAMRPSMASISGSGWMRRSTPRCGTDERRFRVPGGLKMRTVREGNKGLTGFTKKEVFHILAMNRGVLMNTRRPAILRSMFSGCPEASFLLGGQRKTWIQMANLKRTAARKPPKGRSIMGEFQKCRVNPARYKENQEWTKS